jgi:hypothetical protein
MGNQSLIASGRTSLSNRLAHLRNIDLSNRNPYHDLLSSSDIMTALTACNPLDEVNSYRREVPQKP